METHNEEFHLAKLHFIAEQDARQSYVSGSHDPGMLPCPYPSMSSTQYIIQ